MKKFLKRISAVAAAVAIITAGSSVCAREMWIHVNNHGLQRNICQVWGFDMIPILDIAGELGFNVNFDGTTAVLHNDAQTFKFTLGDASVYDGAGNWYGLDVVPQYIDGRLMIPVKFLTDVFGYSYVWDPYMDYLFLNSEEMYNKMLSSESYELAKQYNSYERIQIAKQKLGIPNWLNVDCIYGAPYYWQGAGMYMTPISFYHNGEYVAGADFDTATFQNMKSIYNYSDK